MPRQISGVLTFQFITILLYCVGEVLIADPLSLNKVLIDAKRCNDSCIFEILLEAVRRLQPYEVVWF